MEHPLGREKLSKLIIQYSIPSIISFVVNSLYNMVDQVFIGQGVGYLGNAATNVIMPLTTIMLALGLMITTKRNNAWAFNRLYHKHNS